MSMTDHLIADYLKRKGLVTTLKSLESELSIGSTTHPLKYEPLEEIIEDRLKYHNHNEITKSTPKANDLIENAHVFDKWNEPTASHMIELEHGQLIIHMSKCVLKIEELNKTVLFITSSDKKLTIMDMDTQRVIQVLDNLHQGVGKCAYGVNETNRFVSCGMDGKIKLYELGNTRATLLSEIQLHRRLITDLKICTLGDTTYIFSIGWDLQLKLSKILNSTNTIEIVSSFKLLSNATSIALSTYKKEQPILFLSRLDSTQLSLFTFHDLQLFEISRLSLNDAEFSTHAFTPMTISISNTDQITQDTYIAIGTSHVPYMRLIILKIPDLKPLLSIADTNSRDGVTPHEQHIASTVTHRGMILGNYNTLAPQDKYSQGVVCWRSDKSGVWISGDDGIIRGLDLKNGEVVKECKGHEKRIKCLMVLQGRDDEEVLISSGIDKKLNYWTCT